MVAVVTPLLPWLVAWPLSVRIAARRPASWLAAGIACGTAWAAGPLEAMAVAALATVAATGEMPPSGIARLLGGWLAGRLVWPLAGLATATALQPPSGGGAACFAVLMMAVALWAVRRAGATTADTMSLSMLTATAALVVGGVVGTWLGTAMSWAALATLGPWLVQWVERRADGSLPRGGGEMVTGLMLQTPLRRILGRTAMATMLLAMVGWLLLDPTQAGWAAALGAVWMLCLVFPITCFAGGIEIRAGSPWAALLQSTPGLRHGRALFGGSLGMLVETVIRHAVVLGWPSLVAAAVALGSPTGPWPALVVAVAILATAGAMLLVTLACHALGISNETAFAAVLALVAAALLLHPMVRHNDVAAFRLDLPDCVG